MGNIIAGIIGIIGVGIAVKVFDDKIRPYHYRKLVVDVVAIASLLSFIVGIIRIIIGR